MVVVLVTFLPILGAYYPDARRDETVRGAANEGNNERTRHGKINAYRHATCCGQRMPDEPDPQPAEPARLITEMPEASQAQIDAAVAAAGKRLKAGQGQHPPSASGYLLADCRRASRAEADAFAALEALNCGKPINAVRNDEIPAIVDCFRFFAGAVRNMHGAIAGEYLPGHTSMVRRDPVGIVGSIAPWNYPLMMVAWKLAPAIAGGNTVVIKPSEKRR